jgi:hypothetical protein
MIAMKNRFKKSIWWRKSYLWITLLFFLVSFSLHWTFGWQDYKREEADKGKVPETGEFVSQMMRDTMENWQSEFVQLMWQVCGLAIFIYAGAPESKDGDERKEEKIDYLLKKIDPENYEQLMRKWDEKYPRQ